MMSIDPVWEQLHSTREWGKYPSEQVIRFVARNYYKRKRSEVKILDFGCGAGANTWFLAREGFDTYAFDGSESAVANTVKMLKDEGLSAEVIVSDGLNLNYPDDFFDAVIDSVAIYANKTENIINMYQKIYNVLKESGKIFSSVFGTKTTGCGLGNKIEENTYTNIPEGPVKERGTAHFFTEDKLKNMLEDINFKDVVIDKIFYTDQGSDIEMLIASGTK